MSVQTFVAVYLVDVEIFNWISEKFDLLVPLEKKSGDHQSRQGSCSGHHECLYNQAVDQPTDIHTQTSKERATIWAPGKVSINFKKKRSVL